MHDPSIPTPSVPLSITAAAVGPVVLGAIIGSPGGPFAAAHDAMTVPALVFGVTLIMVPALYVATAIAGAAPSARGFGRAVGLGLRSCGVAMLGLAAPAAFLVATGEDAEVGFVVGAAVLATGILIGLRALYRTLFAEPRTAVIHVVVYFGWSCLALIIGALFYLRAPAQ